MQYPSEKPYKVWSCDRETRKSVIASNLEELKSKGSQKLGYESVDQANLRLVLESDGTEVEDDDCFFQMTEKETVFLLLKDDEKWLPAGVEALKSAISAFPGNVTVVLQLDNRDPAILVKRGEPPWKLEVVSVDKQQPMTKEAQQPLQPHESSQQQQLQATLQRSIPSIRNGVSLRANLTLDGLKARSSLPNQPKRDINFISSTKTKLGLEEDEEEEEEEDDSEMLAQTRLETSPNHDHSQCDFHCSALHREGTEIRISKSVATSPIQEGPIVTLGLSSSSSPISINLPVISCSPSQLNSKRSTAKGVQHVRFKDTESTNGITTNGTANNSDSETETTEREEEQLSERYLMLVDQLSLDQDRHLTLKDIGIILERLSSKIVDVDKLEREKESQDCYNWLIKATIRGEVLREIGVIYNGQYYGIMEHPGYF